MERHKRVAALLVTAGLIASTLEVAAGQAASPVTCDGPSSCSVSPALYPWPDRKDCKVAKVFYPSTEQELVAAVAKAVRAGRNVRVISESHSAPKLVCPRGDRGYLISTTKYNRNIVVDREKLTVTADAGVKLTPLFRTLAQHGVAFPHSPLWAGVSIAGVLATGSHGSSLWGEGSAMYEYVVGVRLVVPASESEGYAKIVTLGPGDEDLNAAKLSLGLFGVISTVTLRVQPLFKRSLTFVQKSDNGLARAVVKNARRFEFGYVSWYPHMGLAVFREDKRVPVSTPGEGVYEDHGFKPAPVSTIIEMRKLEAVLEATRNASGKCAVGALSLQQAKSTGFGFKNHRYQNAFDGFPIVGFQDAIQAYGTCDEAPFLNGSGSACFWDRRIQDGPRMHQSAFVLSLEHLDAFIADVKALAARDPISLCGLGIYGGILMRFVKKSAGAYLGFSADAVSLGIMRFRSSNARTPTLSGSTYDEIDQILQFKYGARPHFGKNWPSAYIDSHKRFPNLPKFLEVARRLDPRGCSRPN